MRHFAVTAVDLRNIVQIISNPAELSLHFVGNDPNPIHLQTSSPENALSWKTVPDTMAKLCKRPESSPASHKIYFRCDCYVTKQILSHLETNPQSREPVLCSPFNFRTQQNRFHWGGSRGSKGAKPPCGMTVPYDFEIQTLDLEAFLTCWVYREQYEQFFTSGTVEKRWLDYE